MGDNKKKAITIYLDESLLFELNKYLLPQPISRNAYIEFLISEDLKKEGAKSGDSKSD